MSAILVFLARFGSGGDNWFCGKYGGGVCVGILFFSSLGNVITSKQNCTRLVPERLQQLIMDAAEAAVGHDGDDIARS